MNPRDLKNAFPPMPETCRDALMTAASSVQEEERTMKHTFRAAALAVALMLALTSAAYAVTRAQVLDWLLGGSEAGTWLEHAAQAVDGSASAEGVKLAITGLVYDGERLVLSYEASVDDPTRAVFVALDDTITLNGVSAALDTIPASDRLMVPSTRLDVLPVRRNPVLAGVWSKQLPALSGMVEAEVTFLIGWPEKGIAFVDEWGDLTSDLADKQDADARAEEQDRRDAISALADAVVIQDNPDAWYADGYTLVYPSGTLYAQDEGADAHLTETRLTVRFLFNADATAVYDFSDAAAAALPDATVRIGRFRLSPLSTRIQVDLVPLENTEEAARLLRDAYGEACLTDEKGREVDYAPMDYMSSGAPVVMETDGQWVCRYDIDMPGLQALPASVGLTAGSGDLVRFPLNPQPED